MYGSIGTWFYRYVAGVELNGLDTLTIRPRMPFNATLMRRMHAEIVTLKGPVAVAYERSGDDGREVDMKVTVPLNARAVVVLEPLLKGGACLSVWEGSTLVYKRGVGATEEKVWLDGVAGVTAGSVDADTGAVSVEVEGGQYHFHAQWVAE